MEFITPKVNIILYATSDILTASTATTEEQTTNPCTTELPQDVF